MSMTFLRDAAERILWTFAYAFVQALIVAQVYDVDAVKAAALSAIPVVLVAIKALVASRVGNPDSASIGGE